MYLSLVLAVSMTGQTVILGLEPGIETKPLPVLAAATAEELVDMVRLLEENALLRPDKPGLVKGLWLDAGERAAVVAELKLTRMVDGKELSEPGLRVRLLDGRRAGMLVVVRKSRTRTDDGPTVEATADAPVATTDRREAEMKRTIEKEKARRSAMVRAGKKREAIQEAEDKAAIAKAEADYKAALPFMLENQRQQLERMSAMERNAALQQMAKSNDKIAEAIQYSAYRGGR